MSYDRQDKEEARIYLLKNKTEKITPPIHAWQDSFPKKEAQNQTKINKKKTTNKQQTQQTQAAYQTCPSLKFLLVLKPRLNFKNKNLLNL